MQFIKRIIRKIIYNSPIHLRRYIILESNPDLADNTYALYKTLLKNKVNEKYKIFWFVYNKSLYEDINIKNVFFINFFGEKTLFEKIKAKYINIKAKYIIDCNKYIYKKNRRQKRLYLGHGMPIKTVPEYCNQIGKTDYILSLSDFFIEPLSKLFHTSENTIIPIGYPRNDDLFVKNKSIKLILKDIEFKKVIMWLPTYRQRVNKDSELTMKDSYGLGIPIIYNIESLRKINDCLKENNILLILKPHPAQDMSLIKTEDLSNFIIITNSDLEKANINLYEFLAQTDALITDYSSVYYDYLLIDKPIGITTDDIEEYKKIFGLLCEDIYTVVKAEYISDLFEFEKFIKNIASESDVARKQREEAKNSLIKYQDGNSSQRVYEFLRDNMGMK